MAKDEDRTEAGVDREPNKYTRLGLKPEVEAALAYIPLMAFVVVLMEHQDPYINNYNSVFYAKYHGFQSFFCFAIYFIVAVICSIIDALVDTSFGIFSLVWWVIYLVLICVSAVLAYQRGVPPRLQAENVDEQLFSLLCLGRFAHQFAEKYIKTSCC